MLGIVGRWRMRSLTTRSQRLAVKGRHRDAVRLSGQALDLGRRYGCPPEVDGGELLGTLLYIHAVRLDAVNEATSAVPVAEEAVSMARRAASDPGREPPDHPDLALALEQLGLTLVRCRRADEGDDALAEAARIRRARGQLSDASEAYSAAAAACLTGVDPQGALRWSEQSLTVLHGADADVEAARVRALVNHAVALRRVGRWEEAVRTQREVVSALRARPTSDAGVDALPVAVLNLAMMTYDVGRDADALSYARQAVALSEDLVVRAGPEHRRQLALALHVLGAVLGELGHHDEAVPVSVRAVVVRRGLHALDPDGEADSLAVALGGLAENLARSGRAGEAVAAAEEARAVLEAARVMAPERHRLHRMAVLASLVVVWTAAGHRDEAVWAAEQAISQAELVLAEQPAQANNVGQVLADAARALLGAGDRVRAVATAERALEVLGSGPFERQSARARAVLADAAGR